MSRVPFSIHPLKASATRLASKLRRNRWRFGIYYATNAIIALVAIALRYIHASVIYYSPRADMSVYLQVMRETFETTPAVKHMIFPPGYSYFLHIIHNFFVFDTIKPILYAQAVIEGLVVLCLASLSRFWFNARAGVFAALIYCFYKLSIVHSGLVMSETLGIAGAVVSVWLFSRFVKRPGWFVCIATGLAVAVSTHVRTNILPIVFLFALYMIFSRRQPVLKVPQRLSYAACLILVTAAALLPWSLRNSMVRGKLTFLSTNTAMNLLQGNNAYSQGGWVGSFTPEINEKLEKASPQEEMELWGDFAKEFIRTHPAYELFYLIPKKIDIYFDEIFDQQYPWDDTHLGGNFSTDPFGPYLFVPLLTFTPLAVFGFTGFLMPARRSRWFVPGLAVLLFVPMVMVPAVPRYRSLVDPFFVLATGAALAQLSRAFRLAFLKQLIIITTAIVVVSAGGSLIKMLKYSGPNLLDTRATLVTGPAHTMMRSTYSTASTSPTSTIKFVPLASLPVRPGYESHLLFSFDYRITNAQKSNERQTIDFKLETLDDKGKPVTVPAPIPLVVPRNAFLNKYQETKQHAWRIVRLPSLARTLQISLISDVAGDAEISGLSVTGPVWNHK